MTRFIEALLTFLEMYKEGFYFTRNTHQDKKGGRWGFYRFNTNKEKCLFDLDFSFDKDKRGYFHLAGVDIRRTKNFE